MQQSPEPQIESARIVHANCAVRGYSTGTRREVALYREFGQTAVSRSELRAAQRISAAQFLAD